MSTTTGVAQQHDGLAGVDPGALGQRGQGGRVDGRGGGGSVPPPPAGSDAARRARRPRPRAPRPDRPGKLRAPWPRCRPRPAPPSAPWAAAAPRRQRRWPRPPARSTRRCSRGTAGGGGSNGSAGSGHRRHLCRGGHADGIGPSAASTPTAPDGSYLLFGLAAGCYVVEFVATGHVITVAVAAGDDGFDSDADRTTGRSGNTTGPMLRPASSP